MKLVIRLRNSAGNDVYEKVLETDETLATRVMQALREAPQISTPFVFWADDNAKPDAQGLLPVKRKVGHLRTFRPESAKIGEYPIKSVEQLDALLSYRPTLAVLYFGEGNTAHCREAKSVEEAIALIASPTGNLKYTDPKHIGLLFGCYTAPNYTITGLIGRTVKGTGLDDDSRVDLRKVIAALAERRGVDYKQEEARYYSCKRKKKLYEAEAVYEAKAATHRAGHAIVAYHCANCNHWHIGRA